MIKGHTEIQLYKDGKMVQNTHDDNMLTNALAGYFKNYGLLNPTPFGSDIYNDFITTLLGGVLLLDTALPEQASLTHVPGGVLMVGNGAYGVSNGSTPGDPTEMGSFNASQSGWADNNKTQFRMVWDFTTEQSNGTIACACLTSRAHGFVGEGNATSKAYRTNESYNNGTYGQITTVPSAHNKIYIDSTEYTYTIDGIKTDHTVEVYRQKRTLNNVDLRNVYNSNDSDVWKTFELSSSVPTEGSIHYIGEDANNIYVAAIPYYAVILLTILKSFNSIRATVINATDIPTVIGNLNSFSWLCDGNYLYAFGDNSGYKIDITDNTVTPMIYDAGFDSGRNNKSDDGAKIRFNGNIYDKTLNRLLKTNSTSSSGVGALTEYNIGHPYKESLYIDSGATGPWHAPASARRNDYIATINNLSTPVTKDNTQTMKVIYTLSFTG